jgi:transcriptional regulator with XRE-family HTH domain
MSIHDRLTDKAVLTELGERLARWRLERNLSQGAVGDEAGVGRRTVQRLEAGESVQLTSFIRVLRVLGLLESLDRLIPEPTPSPLERLKLAGRERQRARRSRPSDSDTEGPWRWGDEGGR